LCVLDVIGKLEFADLIAMHFVRSVGREIVWNPAFEIVD